MGPTHVWTPPHLHLSPAGSIQPALTLVSRSPLRQTAMSLLLAPPAPSLHPELRSQPGLWPDSSVWQPGGAVPRRAPPHSLTGLAGPGARVPHEGAGGGRVNRRPRDPTPGASRVKGPAHTLGGGSHTFGTMESPTPPQGIAQDSCVFHAPRDGPAGCAARRRGN